MHPPRGYGTPPRIPELENLGPQFLSVLQGLGAVFSHGGFSVCAGTPTFLEVPPGPYHGPRRGPGASARVSPVSDHHEPAVVAPPRLPDLVEGQGREASRAVRHPQAVEIVALVLHAGRVRQRPPACARGPVCLCTAREGELRISPAEQLTEIGGASARPPGRAADSPTPRAESSSALEELKHLFEIEPAVNQPVVIRLNDGQGAIAPGHPKGESLTGSDSARAAKVGAVHGIAFRRPSGAAPEGNVHAMRRPPIRTVLIIPLAARPVKCA